MRHLLTTVGVVFGLLLAVTAHADYCTGRWQGAGDVLAEPVVPGLTYAAYQDPAEVGCEGTYPFMVESISVMFVSEVPEEFLVVAEPILMSADLSEPSCPKPGVVLYRGGVQGVIVTPATLTATFTFPDPLSCVDRPYFAAVELLDFAGPGMIFIVADNGVSLVSGEPRPCATYKNNHGWWEDLIMDNQFPGNIVLWSEGYASSQNDCTGCTEIIERGVDLWFSDRDGLLVPPNVFVSQPLPADFFGPGSDPFDNPVAFEGDPIPTDPPDALHGADAIIERKERALMPSVPSATTVETELIALRLVSTMPIRVSYNGGMSYEDWDVLVCLSPVQVIPTTMELNRECCDGGQFNHVGGFRPRFLFTNVQNPTPMIYDYPTTIGYPTGAYWSSAIHPPFDVVQVSPGNVTVDHDCDNGTGPIRVPPSSRVIFSQLYHQWFEEPCGNCCHGRVGDANGMGGDEPTIGDVSVMIDAKFITGTCVGILDCLAEADVNQSGTLNPTCGDITIGDISVLIDYLFITGPSLGLPLCW